MRSLGYKDLRVDDLVKLRIHGVSPAFIREMRDLGYKDLALERRRADAHPRRHDRIRQGAARPRLQQRAGDDLVKMRIHGVTPEFIRDVNAAGFKNMSADDLVDFSIHGRRWLKKRA